MGILAGLVFLAMFGLICFVISGFIIAALNQFAGINLFFCYKEVPVGTLILTCILLSMLLYFITRDKTKDLK